MFARNISLRLESDTLPIFTKALEEQILPTLRAAEGASGDSGSFHHTSSGRGCGLNRFSGNRRRWRVSPDRSDGRGPMPNQIQAGTMIVQSSVHLQSLEIQSEPYYEGWRSLGSLESAGLDNKIRAAGWKLFFMAGELKTVVAGWGGESTLRRGIKRLLTQTRLQHFNCFELTTILKRRFLGIPYVSLAGHSRHIQLGSQIRSAAQRAHDSAS